MVSAFFRPGANRLLQALALFEQTFGKSASELDLQAILGAIAAVTDGLELAGHELDDTIRQMATLYQQVDGQLDRLGSLEDLGETMGRTALDIVIQAAQTRLAEAEETLTLVIRTYLQRVSSQLSASEFVDLAKTAIGLLSQERQLSGAEGKRLLYGVLQTFSTKLSQPIPVFGERMPQGILDLVQRLLRYQAMLHGKGGLEAALITLVVKRLKASAQYLSPGFIRMVLANSTLTIDPSFHQGDGLNEEGLADLANAMFFKMQFQISSSTATKSSQEMAEQMDQAIAAFQKQYQPVVDVTRPIWTDDLSIRSPMVNSDRFD